MSSVDCTQCLAIAAVYLGAQRKLEIETKFAELKKKGKLDRFMEKKRKRNAARDRKAVPVAE